MTIPILTFSHCQSFSFSPHLPPEIASSTNMARTGIKQKKRVLVIGAGSAGMACADQLSLKRDLFDVTLVDAVGYCGGQAFSIPIDKERCVPPVPSSFEPADQRNRKNRYNVGWLNQGVQGGSHIYHHTFHMFSKQGVQAEPYVDNPSSFCPRSSKTDIVSHRSQSRARSLFR